MFHWNQINSISQLEEIDILSFEKNVVIFKHSTRCSISVMVLHRLERETQPNNILFYYLDLIQHRDISNTIAEKYHVHHESPQCLIIKNGECVYDESHNGISMKDILDNV